jgi:hypothetical protein
MTKDTHFQMAVMTECVTPNVPRIRSSFFNRKFRDISGGSDGHTQLTPTTPKVNNSKAKNTPSTRSRSRRSGGNSSGDSRRTKTNLPNNGRPSRSRPNNDEFYDQDFSTPRATRSLLTPPRTSTKINKHGKVTHVIYQPLELDNESSSESNDKHMRMQHKRPKWMGSQETKLSPLAIEASIEPVEKFSTFIPGNCNIDDILDLFGKQQQQRSESCNDTKDGKS